MSKILLVEDDQNLSEIYEARLSAEGYEIVSAANGEDALAIASKEKPDLVISDVMMPRVSGFEMLDILRHTDGMQAVKIIMLTALGQDNDRSKASELGADRYLVKSQVTLEDIVSTAKELLGDAEAPSASEPASTPAAAPTPTEPAPAPAASEAPAAPSPSAPTPSAPLAANEPVGSPSPVTQPAVPGPTASEAPAPSAPPKPNPSSPPLTEAQAEAEAEQDAEPLAVEEAQLAASLQAGGSASANPTNTTSTPTPAPSQPADSTTSTPPLAGPTPVVSNQPSASTSEPTVPSNPIIAPPTDSDAASNPPAPTPSHDEVLAEALKQLENETSPTPTPGAPATTPPASDTRADPANHQAISGHKIIQPPDTSEAKPNINDLLAKEANTAGAPTSPPEASPNQATPAAEPAPPSDNNPQPDDPRNFAL